MKEDVAKKRNVHTCMKEIIFKMIRFKDFLHDDIFTCMYNRTNPSSGRVGGEGP